LDAIKFIYIFLQFDDFIDDSPDSELSKDLLNKYKLEIQELDKGVIKDDTPPRLKIIAEFLKDMKLKMTDYQFDEFKKDFKCYMESSIWARLEQETGGVYFNSLDKLIDKRRCTGGSHLVTDIAWYAVGADGLDRKFWDDPDVKRMKDLYFDISQAANDIYSYKKEADLQKDKISYVIHFYNHEANGDLNRAVKMTRDIIYEWYKEFLKLAAKVKQRKDIYHEDANKIISYMKNFNPAAVGYVMGFSKRYENPSD